MRTGPEELGDGQSIQAIPIGELRLLKFHLFIKQLNREGGELREWSMSNPAPLIRRNRQVQPIGFLDPLSKLFIF